MYACTRARTNECKKSRHVSGNPQKRQILMSIDFYPHKKFRYTTEYIKQI